MAELNKYVTKGRDEFATTALGANAFDGKIVLVDAALVSGVNWKEEGTHPLNAAIHGQQIAIVKKLITAGSPVDLESYKLALVHCKDAMTVLPIDHQLFEQASADQRQLEFCWCLVHERLETAVKLLAEGVDIDKMTLITHGMGLLAPIHYARGRLLIETVKIKFARLVLRFSVDNC